MKNVNLEGRWMDEEVPIFCGGIDSNDVNGLMHNVTSIISFLTQIHSTLPENEGLSNRSNYGLYLILSGLENTMEKAMAMFNQQYKTKEKIVDVSKNADDSRHSLRKVI